MSRINASITERGRWRNAIAAVLASAAAALFWLPALPASRGWFPAPLDDVYIHFDFARALGQGHPFEWIAGQGYSSGETSPLYAFVLAIGWVFGFRGRALGVWAAIVAVLGVASLVGSIRRLVRPCPSWLGWTLAVLPLSIGVVDWTLFSGMEVAVFAAALGRSLEALAEARRAGPGRWTREALQWRVGAWGIPLVLLRPEAAVIVAVFALVAARGAGRRSGVLAVLRAAAPGALATMTVLGLNRLATGDARSAGAQLKLLSSNPYMSDVDRARVFAENLATFWVKVVRGELTVVPSLALLLPALGLVGVLLPRRRPIAAACLGSAVVWILLVSWNGNAPHHNFRYYAPALILIAIAAALGLASIAVTRYGIVLATVMTGLALASTTPQLGGQIRHFHAACGNIRDQHVEIGERIARLPEGARILVGDAGAIPYVSNRTAIDALGLGGYHGVPFVHAAVHGEAATIELIERLPPNERPTHFALYPNWFGVLTSRFGVEIDRVTIAGNVICGSPTKVIYRADWSTLGERPWGALGDVVDEIDVADVIDEAEHSYVAPLPHGGWTTHDVLLDRTGALRFDGGRTIPDGASESFVARHDAAGPLTLRVRVDGAARGIVLRAGGLVRELVLEAPRERTWRSATTSLDGVRAGDVLTLTASGGVYRDYHVWIERDASRR